MDTQRIPFKEAAARFWRSVREFGKSEAGPKAKLLFAALVVLLTAATGLNVLNSYVGRNFMTAIANRNNAEFMRQAVFYIGVFAASTVVAVIAKFAEERLGVLWRENLTKRAVSIYLADRTYCLLEASGGLANPDQRIAEDTKAFTTTTLSFILMFFNSSLTVIAFSDVLWTISPLLFAVAVLYAAVGSYITLVLGRPLIKLNYDQLDKEASFRSALIHVRENAESILVGGYEGVQQRRLLRRLDDLVANFRRITSVNRNVGFFSTGYNWMIQIIPALIVAPAFFKGEIEFGVVTQSAMVFATLVAAFSLIVTQYQSMTNFAAVVERLSRLMTAIEETKSPETSGVTIAEADGPIVYEDLTVSSSNRNAPLIKDLSLSIPAGARVLVAGSSENAGIALFRATAGAAVVGKGRIVRPSRAGLRFLPQRPYLPPATLREILQDQISEGSASDDRIVELVRELGLEQMLAQAGGLDAELDWSARLSFREQQLLACARALLAGPRFVYFDRIEAVLGPDESDRLQRMLIERSIGCVHIATGVGQKEGYDAVLSFEEDGAWKWSPNKAPNPNGLQ